MKIIITFFLVIACFGASGQNVVANSNFAIFDTCPDAPNQLTRCHGWINPTGATPDYYNACQTVTAMGVPDNTFGSQASASGAYAGIITRYVGHANYREYIGTNVPALTVGAVYRCVVIMSLADIVLYATKPPGIFFYKDVSFAGVTALTVLPYTPQIDFSYAQIVTDRVNWVTVADTFVADSAYTNLIVGNFHDDANTDTLHLSGTAGPHAYYYIDSVSVEKIADHAFVSTTPGTFRASLYPNPLIKTAILDVNSVAGTHYTLSIVNVQGAVMRIINTTDKQIPIDRDGLPSGIYFYRLESDAGVVVRDKLVVQ